MTDSKKLILDAFHHIKSASVHFAEIVEVIEGLDPALIENSNIAFGELIKCIKHLALIQGDITGKELMSPEEMKTNLASPDIKEGLN